LGGIRGSTRPGSDRGVCRRHVGGGCVGCDTPRFQQFSLRLARNLQGTYLAYLARNLQGTYLAYFAYLHTGRWQAEGFGWFGLGVWGVWATWGLFLFFLFYPNFAPQTAGGCRDDRCSKNSNLHFYPTKMGR
jgi:hypothetical protein